MHNVAPSRALARRTRQWLTFAFVVAAIGIFVAVVGLALFVIPLTAPGSASAGLFGTLRVGVLALGVLIFFIALGLCIRALTLRKDNDLAMIVGRFLTQYLDNRYHFVRHVSKRNLGYVDAILVGPPGALVFRILDNRGAFINEGANWIRQDQYGQVTAAGIDPTRECVLDVKKLREYLEARQLGSVPVYGVVVFTKDEPAVQLVAKEPVVPITTLRSLVATLGSNYLARDRIDPGKITTVVRLLVES